jgi:hypothetical protein
MRWHGLEILRENNVEIVALTSEKLQVSGTNEKLRIENTFLGVKDKYSSKAISR